MSEEFDNQRRKFLTAGMLPGADLSSDDPVIKHPLDRQASHFERYSKTAMACEFELLLNLHHYKQAAEFALASFAILDSIEDQMSIYRAASELSNVNRKAAAEPVRVDERLFEILQLAKTIHSSTGGAFDVTATPLSRLWGFHRRQGCLPDHDSIEEALVHVGTQHLELHSDQMTVRFAIEGLTLDLGGIGKGFAVDLAADLLVCSGINDFVLQGGQSSVAAYGRNIIANSDGDEHGWRIGLSHPATPDCRLAEFELIDQKLGTSGSQRQGFFVQGRRLGHIIDPRSGYPTDHCLSATVICDKAAVADALATAFFIMKIDEVQQYCDQESEVSAILVYPGNKSGVRLETFNCDELKWRIMI